MVGRLNGAGLALGLLIALQTVYTAYFGVFDPALHRPIVTGLCVLAAVLTYASTEAAKGPRGWYAWVYDVVLVALVMLGLFRFLVHADNAENMLIDFSRTDQAIALASVLALIELSRREFGWSLAAFAYLVVAYCFAGNLLPGWLGHAGFSLDQAMQGMWFGFQGVFGMPVGVLLEVLFIYIVFGVVLEASGAGPAMIRMSLRLVGRISGGAAHGAIVASGIFGTMSGSVVANVVGTGTFTIPMMKRQGFRPEFAGAVEAAASTGGQIMPPVMGASAFLMAQLTGISYLTICLAAIVPALLYYGSLFTAVYFEAKRLGIRPLTDEELPEITREDWINSLIFIAPIIAIITVMIAGRSPAMAGFWATMSALVLSVLNKDVRARPMVLVDALARGGISCAKILIAVGAIGVVIAGLNLTGLGLAFAQAVLALSGSSLLLALLLTALACIILGTGLPTLPSYLIIVLVMGPAIAKLGVPILAIHMFVFYYGIISDLTPPVALAAMAAAPIAGANPVTVGVIATRLALVKFVLPFVFVYNPSLLLVLPGFEWQSFIWALIRLIVATLAMSTGFAAFDRRPLPKWDVALRLIGGALAIIEIPAVAAIGIAMAVTGFVLHRMTGNRTSADTV